MKSLSHLLWMPAGLFIGFLLPFVFADRLDLPQNLYYLIYFISVISFFILYVRRTELDLQEFLSRHLGWALTLGVMVGIVMMQNVLSRPETTAVEGVGFWWDLFWRGLVYGTVDGLLLFAFPWLVVWRALEAGKRNYFVKIVAGLAALICILLITTTYHLGYRDFRNKKIIQSAIGSTITSVPTIFSANPIASVISHIFLHITAVVHTPYTEMFLPPHRADENLMNAEKQFLPPEVDN